MAHSAKLRSFSALTSYTTQLNTNCDKVLVVRPVTRPYISASDAVYDYHVGYDFTVADQSSSLNNCPVTCLDRHILKANYGITHLHIKYNPGLPVVEVAL